ncbi:MAG: hypothetical protein P8Y12_03615 [Gammaproteobacteria bacterium]
MPAQQQKYDPTDPGPFQKYLFSGACYVQIGQCYALVKQAASQGKLLTNDDRLKANLVEVWNSYVTKQFGELSLLQEGGDNSEDEMQQWRWVNQLHQEVHRAGIEVVQDLLPALARIDSDRLDLKQFFMIWAKSCDLAYARLVKSDVFARALGEITNTMINATVNGRST